MSDKTKKVLLDAKDIRQEYGIGKNTVYVLLSKLPSEKIGRRRLIIRSDLEEFLSEVARSGESVHKYLRKEKPAR